MGLVLAAVVVTPARGEVPAVTAAPAISVPAMQKHLQELQNIANRNGGNRAAGTAGYTASANYVAQVLTTAGYTVTRQRCTTCTNTRDENIIASWPGSSPDTIMLGAHLDGVRAGPGIEDNGSGSAALLEIARAVAANDPGFTRTITFAWWAEEELGMHGSRHYVTTTGVAAVDAYVGMDMIAGTNAGYFVNNLNGNLTGPFASYLTSVGKAPEEFTDCCSDDQPFSQAGVPSTLLTTGYGENKTAAQAAKWGGTAGRPFDPCYHKACDTYPANINTTALGHMANAVATGLWAVADRQLNRYTPEEVCGSGFSVIDSHSFGAAVGAVFLLYSKATGDNCVTTLKYTKVGTASQVTSVLQPQGGSQVKDGGNFSYYAGPVRAHAPDVCVRWGGSVDDKSWLSPYEHCGSTPAKTTAVQANLCGSSYVKIDTYPVKNGTATYGNVELYWSASAKRNCALTIGAGATYGWKGFKSVSVCPTGAADSYCGRDQGDYLYYAGPAYTKAGYDMTGRCVDVIGIIEHPSGASADGGGARVHCG